MVTLQPKSMRAGLNVPVQFASLVLLCLYFFRRNEGALYFSYDGAYMMELLKFHFEWTPFTTDVVFNPLQGLANLSLPNNFWFSPASLISYLLYGANPNSLAVYTVTTVELFASIWLLARSLGASRVAQIAASWCAAICAMPFLVPPHSLFVSFNAVSGLTPFLMELIALSSIMIVLVLQIRSADSIAKTCIATTGFLILAIYAVVAFPPAVILDAPFVFLFFLYGLFFRRKSGRREILACLAMAAGLAAPMLFIMSLVIQSVPAFFNSELIYGRPGLIFISLLFHGPYNLGWMSSLIFVAGLCGAAVAISRNTGRLALVAYFYIGYSLLLVGLGLLTTFVFDSYRGPSMLYFEWMIWPFMFIYASHLFAELVGSFLRGLFLAAKPWLGQRMWRLPEIAGALLFPLVAAGFVSTFSNPKAMATIVASMKRPPGKTPFVKYLQEEVGLTPGSAWRGSVANFSGTVPAQQGTGWHDQLYYDSQLWRAAGNDHRSFGLWWYGIPTLFAYNQFMPPDYYFVMARLFADPRDIQQRSVVVLTRPNANLLRLFGVRFVISGDPLQQSSDIAFRQSFDWQTSPHRAQYLYETIQPNLGNFAPTRPIVEPTGLVAMARMKDPGFDPEHDVVLQESVSDPLSEVTSSSIYWEKAGLHVVAKSSGNSLLVLPLQYSDCLQVQSDRQGGEAGQVKLIRSDIMLTGVQFSKQIDATIQFRFGPFDNVLCRTRDFLDFRKMMRPS